MRLESMALSPGKAPATGKSSATVQSINPATGTLNATYDLTPATELPGIVENAHKAFLQWRRTPFEDRSAPLRRVAATLREHERKYASLMAREMGKPIRGGVEEVRASAWLCDHFAEYAEDMLAREPVPTGARKSYVVFKPLGVVLGVEPWNWPFHQVFRLAAPALMAGNAVVVKHASNVPGCALAIEEIFHHAGLPRDLFRVVLIAGRQVDSLIDNPLVRAVSLTGSGSAGSAVARKAGELLKKSVLELGGSDPYLILEDADLELAARVCTKGRLMNSGQSCIAAKRMIVVEKVREPFEKRFVKLMSEARMGDPLDEHTDVGPLARTDLRDNLHRQVEQSIAKGARLLLGGKMPDGPGAFYPVTVLTDVRPGMPAFDEETFGPAAAIVPVKDEDAAIESANNSAFGLGSCVISRDLPRAERIASELLEAGMAYVNHELLEDPRLPFGGIKESGYGREMGSYGIKEFVNIKTVYVA
jgi:succinate-semialdehyde dehydrogenase/glutarate-semialdehyde dehydrogenase